ncbi:MAG: CdaR family protein [Clostridia bacterium]|nr:CdaR family protein [Clostridia bacterium]
MENNSVKSKFSLAAILSNNKALLVISFLLAFIAWLAIAINQAPEVERVIENVKVEIDDSVPSQLGYEVFGVDDLHIDITVKGKRYLVGDNVLSADDFTVTANTTHVDAPGTYSLTLKATPKDPDAEYSIVAKSMDNIEVYFDTPKTAEFIIETNVECTSDNLLASDEYITSDPILSVDKIKVTGPSTEVEKIQKVVASITTKGNLKATETQQATLMVADAYGAEIKYLTITPDSDAITITIPVYTVTELPVTVDLENVPTKYLENPPTITSVPGTIEIAVDAKKHFDEISIGKVDFNTLEPGLNEIDMDLSGVTDGIPTDKDQTVKILIELEEE